MADPGFSLRSLLLPAVELDDSVRFYRDSIGLALVMRDGDVYAELDAGGLKLALATASDHPVPTTPLPTFKTTDMDGALARLETGGASILASPRAGKHEVRAVLQDPAGNAFIIYSSRS
jgi:lactoylglutathione lyase